MRKLQEIYDDQNLTHRAKTVYIYLSDRADALHQCWPSIGTIARELSLSRSTVQRAIQDLGSRDTWKPISGGVKTEEKAVCCSG